MVFDKPNFADNDGAGAGAAGAGTAESLNSSSEPCSICLELVGEDGRSCVKLICGHEFHLDCIGSAFNSRGKMQCPNCRNLEKGEWLYASGIPPAVHSHDHQQLHDSVRGRVYQLLFPHLSSFDEPADLQSSEYHDLLAHYALLAENEASTSTNQPPRYLPFYASTIPDSSYNNHWSTSLSGLNDAPPTSFGIQSVDPQYQAWDLHSSSHPPAVANRLGNADWLSASSMVQMSNASVTSASFLMNPILAAHRRGHSNNIQFLTARTGDPHIHAMQGYYQQQIISSQGLSPLISSSRHSSTHRSSSSPGSGPGYYLFSSNPHNGVAQDQERSVDGWERVHLPPANHAERESEWGLFGRGPSQGR